MHNLITFLSENIVYIGFGLVWVVHFFTALTYSKVARIVRSSPDNSKEKKGLPPVSVIIEAHNQAHALRRNLPSILEQDYDLFEVIVVNSDSTDDTESVLNELEQQYPHLRHTFIPSGSKYISQKRLSLTIGVKAAQYEWLLFTEPNCHPYSSHWISSMAQHFHTHTQIVMGYANYEPQKKLLSKKTIFFNLFHQLQYLPWAVHHKAYRCNPINLAYRKSYFMEHKGFADNVNLISGAMELLVNHHSTKENTERSLVPESKMICESLSSAKLWRQERVYYVETRRHFRHTWLYRRTFNLKQEIITLYYLATLAALGWSIWQEQWIGTAAVSFAFLLLMIWKIIQFNRSTHALDEPSYYLSFLWYELRIPGWAFHSWLSYLFVPRSRFYRKAF
ncbi:MAG: glycosyltransferase [Paraprevotella sp.]|nr:glycosyltransferase [Paraprevotella sp.]